MKQEYEGVNWIHLAQDRVQWEAIMNTVINLVFRNMWGVA